MSYAKNTVVAAEKSRAEIDAVLGKYGATQRGFMNDEEAHRARVFFTLAKRQIRLEIPLPTGQEKEVLRDHRGYPRTAEAQKKELDQLLRARWRIFLLFIKAKLELIAMGVSSVEREFLADIALSDGRTVYQAIQAPLEASYTTGAPLLPAAPTVHEGSLES